MPRLTSLNEIPSPRGTWSRHNIHSDLLKVGPSPSPPQIDIHASADIGRSSSRHVGNQVAAALHAERLAIMHEMERRHAALLQSLESEADFGYHTHAVPEESQFTTKDTASSAIMPAEMQIASCSEDEMTVFKSSTNPTQFKRIRSHMSESDLMQQELANANGLKFAYLRLRIFVFGTSLEMVFAVLIILNALVVAVEAQYRSFDTRQDLYRQGVWPHEVTKRKESVWPGADVVLIIVEMLFGTAFTLEVVLKMCIDARRFAKSLWNWFDAFVVGFWILSVFGLGLDSNPMLLRLLRLVKLIRLLRLVKSIQVFDVLHLLVGSLRASWSVLMWSLALLLCVTCFGALVMNFFLEEFVNGESNPMEIRRDAYQRFGSFTRALVSMFELTLGNWHPPVLVLQEVDEWWVLPCLVYISVVWFAVVQVIRGVFISETFKVAASDDELMIMQKNRQMEEHTRNMDKFIREADVSGDGFVSWEEFSNIVQDRRIKSWLAAIGLDIANAELVFELLDDGDKKLSAEEIVQGVAKLKGTARSIDMVVLNKRCRLLLQQGCFL